LQGKLWFSPYKLHSTLLYLIRYCLYVAINYLHRTTRYW
jgi:hypothetical protein